MSGVTYEKSGPGWHGGDAWLNTYSLMANGYWDIDIAQNTELYLGGGIGAALERGKARVDVSGYGPIAVNGSDWVPAYQAMAGLAFHIADGTYLNVGYRYWTSGDPNFGGDDFKAPGVHSVEVELRLLSASRDARIGKPNAFALAGAFSISGCVIRKQGCHTAHLFCF